MGLPFKIDLGLKVGFDLKTNLLFSDKLLEDKLTKAEMQNLRWSGGYVRKVAISLIKDAPNSARPGNPPHSHIGHYLKQRFKAQKKAGKIQKMPKLKGPQRGIKFVLFGLEPKERKVIVGPVGFRDDGEVPFLTEFGGPAVRFVRGERRRVTYAKHPFMGPALDKSQDKLLDIWANSVK